MDEEQALAALLGALDKWECALIDDCLSAHHPEYRRVLEHAETCLSEAHRAYLAACMPQPEPVTSCLHCEARWNEHYRAELDATEAADAQATQSAAEVIARLSTAK